MKQVMLPYLFALYFIPFTMQAQMHTPDTIRMQYRITGDGPWLVLVPGGLTGWASWDALLPRFDSTRNLQTQLLNVQYGLENLELPAGYSVKTESRALAAALKDAGLREPADMIGWSYGALILLDFALDHPHLVKSLILIEPPAFWVLREHDMVHDETNRYMQALGSFGNEISEDDLQAFLHLAGFVAPGTDVRKDPRWENWVKYRHSLRQSGVVPGHHDSIDRLREFTKPVLLVKGTGSTPFFHQAIDLMVHDFPFARSIELPAGHAPHLVSAGDFLEEAGRFWQRD